MSKTNPAANPTFCNHGVPSGCYCRWCTEGGEPVVAVEPNDGERASRKAAIRMEWDQQTAAIRQAAKGRKTQ